ncbi:MAG: class I SAM-dependent methyltransferase [Bacteriovoracaceae bacterium]|nr:class I SAM-dependent methyltransferase [Bacteriovoracaceae bacterium]
MNFQKHYASSYDLLYSDKNYDEETKLLTSLINEFHNDSDKNLNILEIGCGTGEHARRLLKSGHQIHAIDKSQYMLEIAQAKLRDNTSISFEVGDITSFKSSTKYDVVLMMFHVFSYLESSAQVKNALKNIKLSLKPDGIFIFDYWNTLGVNNFGASTTHKVSKTQNLEVTRKAIPQTINEQIIDVNYELNFLNKVQNESQEFKETHRMRHFTPIEIENYLKEEGFTSLVTYGWGKNTKPTDMDWAGLTVARNS